MDNVNNSFAQTKSSSNIPTKKKLRSGSTAATTMKIEETFQKKSHLRLTSSESFSLRRERVRRACLRLKEEEEEERTWEEAMWDSPKAFFVVPVIPHG